MPRVRRLTLTEFLVVIAIMALLISFLLPTISRMREHSRRRICPSNLRQIGQAIALYAATYGGQFPRTTWRSGKPLVYFTGSQDTTPSFFDGTSDPEPNDVTSSLVLLVREGLLKPETLICPWSDKQVAKSTSQTWNLLGTQHLSYSIIMPHPELAGLPEPFMKDYGKKWASGTFAIAADINPGADQTLSGPQSPQKAQQRMNSPNHAGHGQNVLYGDGHVSWMASPWCGHEGDNIYAPAAMSGASPSTPPRAANGRLPAHEMDTILVPTARD